VSPVDVSTTSVPDCSIATPARRTVTCTLTDDAIPVPLSLDASPTVSCTVPGRTAVTTAWVPPSFLTRSTVVSLEL
jgi:hypothetical protein